MAKSVLIWIWLSFHFLQCLSQESSRVSVGEYFEEAVDLMDRTRWRYFLPEDTDIDQDGQLSHLEVQQKFSAYMGEVFNLIDHDKDKSIVEEELGSLKLDIPQLTKVVDIALENFPLKPFFLAADANKDGVYDKNDFYIPENVQQGSSSHNPSTSDTNYYIAEHTNEVLQFNYDRTLVGIGHKEGTILCKSLGFDGLERVDEFGKKASNYYVIIRFCEGNETRLEDCSYKYSTDEPGMGVVCKGEKLGSLRLEGGIHNSSGDIFLGNKSLICHPGGFEEPNSEVICRELGYPGLVRVTMDSSFTGIYRHHQDQDHKDSLKVRTFFKCNGNEQKLADCPVDTSGDCPGDWKHAYGVICAIDDKPGIDRDLSQLIEWTSNSRIWEEFGRLLFIADANGDGKLTLEELATKAKELLTKILEILDQNKDGEISLDDMNLNLSIEPIDNLILPLFDDVTAGQGEVHLYDMKIRDQHMDKWIGLKNKDQNKDRKLTAADVTFLRSDDSLLIPMLSEKLDNNQDGNIQREELKHFTGYMFNHLDMDNNGVITLEDVYSLLRENGFHCFQVGALRSFIKRFLATIDNESKNFSGYVFHQFDIDGNGNISSEEFEKMYLPCNMTGATQLYNYDTCNYQGYRYDYHDYDPNARRGCEDMFECIGRRLRNLMDSFPSLEMDKYYGAYGPDKYMRERAKKKMASVVCEMLS